MMNSMEHCTRPAEDVDFLVNCEPSRANKKAQIRYGSTPESEHIFNSIFRDIDGEQLIGEATTFFDRTTRLIRFETLKQTCLGLLITSDDHSCHVNIVCRGEDTVLGQTSPKGILHITPQCRQIAVDDILTVQSISIENLLLIRFEDEYYIRFYDQQKCSLQLLPFTIDSSKQFACFGCKPETIKEIKRGDCVIFESNLKIATFNYFDNANSRDDEDYDEELYPERYRKQLSDLNKDCYTRDDLTSSLHVGYVQAIVRDNDLGVEYLKVNLFYRPQHVYEDYEQFKCADLNLLFWTDSTVQIHRNSVLRKCQILLAKKLETNIYERDDVFYFNCCYDPVTRTIYQPTKSIQRIFPTNLVGEIEEKSYTLEPWTVLDVFAGCGGLFYGFQSYTSKVYAIDADKSAMNTFKHNFANKAIIMNSDANLVLQTLLEPNDDFIRHKLPRRGEIDLILGGPPCQGFTEINRFAASDCSMFKSSLVGTYLNYVEYFRPRYCLFENVRNLVSYKKSTVLKVILSFMTRLNYQVRVAILQAGCYGVPQNRKRLFIIASLPTCRLPSFPAASHMFARKHSNTTFRIDQMKYDPMGHVGREGIYRMITVEDAIGDLASLEGDQQYINHKRKYQNKATTHFQRMMQTKDVVTDHYCKRLRAINLERIKRIPHRAGADWRDLPNIELSGESIRLVKLKYQTKRKELRGVCSCDHHKRLAKPCKIAGQANTLIPWCLAHTAARKNQWAGLYGRLGWRGYFPTTLTNPEPISQQGKVLPPAEDRLLSVREMARSQSFPDSFRFADATALDKYRQIGNAVPPLLSMALAKQFWLARQTPPDGSAG